MTTFLYAEMMYDTVIVTTVPPYRQECSFIPPFGVYEALHGLTAFQSTS